MGQGANKHSNRGRDLLVLWCSLLGIFTRASDRYARRLIADTWIDLTNGQSNGAVHDWSCQTRYLADVRHI